MIPPSFSDLGKAAKDLFDKKFVFGNINIECISKKDPKHITVKTSHNTKLHELSSNFEIKHSGNCVDAVLKWSSKNVITAEISKTYEAIKGLKNVGILTFYPNSGNKSLKLKGSYKREYFNFNADSFFDSKYPDVNMNLVFGCTNPKPYLAGVDFTIDTKKQQVSHHTLALAYEKSDFGALFSVSNCTFFNSFVYQKISHLVDIGFHVSHNKDDKETKYGAAWQYKIPNSEDSFVKAKVNQDAMIGLVYGCTLNSGVQLTLSTEIDSKKMETGPHAFGVGFIYEP